MQYLYCINPGYSRVGILSTGVESLPGIGHEKTGDKEELRKCKM